MGIFSGIGEFLFGKAPDVGAAQGQITQGKDDALQSLQMGLNQATGTLQPTINQSSELSTQLQNLLMGNTPTNQIPGFNAMSNARRDAVSDFGTGMGGAGKFFSGSMAEGAANIGGGMQNQFLQQAIQNLMMGAQPGQQMQSNLAGMQMGTGTAGANIQSGAGLNAANLTMGDQSQGIFGDLLSAAGTLGGAYLGSQTPTVPEV